MDARARSGSRPDTAVLSLDCRAESGAPTPLTETAGGDLQRTGAARHDRILKKMTACDLDHRHNERIMQLIARPIGTFPPLDLRPRLDGAFFYRAPPFILPSVTAPHSITSSAARTEAHSTRNWVLTFASRTILAHFSISALICASNSSGVLPIGSNPRVGGRRSRVRIAPGVSEGRQAHVLSDPRDVGWTIEEIIGLGRASWPFAWPVPQPAPILLTSRCQASDLRLCPPAENLEEAPWHSVMQSSRHTERST